MVDLRETEHVERCDDVVHDGIQSHRAVNIGGAAMNPEPRVWQCDRDHGERVPGGREIPHCGGPGNAEYGADHTECERVLHRAVGCEPRTEIAAAFRGLTGTVRRLLNDRQPR